MRIAVNARLLLRHRMEGICRYIHETTKRMVEAHPEDEFILFFDRPFHPSFIYGPNVTPVVLPPPTRDPLLIKIWFDYMIPRALKKHKVDVFLSGDTYMSLRTKVPTVIVSHDIAYHHFPEHLPKRVLNYYQKYFPQFHRQASHVVAVSEFTKSDIMEVYGLESAQVSVAHNATPEGFNPLTDDEKAVVRKKYASGGRYFIYVGSIHPRKNVGNLIRGFQHYRSKGGSRKLLVLGRKAWNFSDYEAMIDGSSSVVWLDGESVDPREVMPAADGLAYVSLHEGFGIPILEAMSCGVPVMTSNLSSMPEVAGEAAILVDPHSVEAIGSGFLKLDTEDHSDLISAGYKRVKSFNWENSASIIYQSLVL